MSDREDQSDRRREGGQDARIWRPPTRRAFVAMLTAAAAAFVIEDRAPAERPRSPWTGKTRWIGHC